MIFTSKNTSVATVNNNGTVTAVSAGNTVIEVKSDNNEYMGQVPVKVVSSSSYIPTTGITLNKRTINLKYSYNSSYKLKATVSPSNATNKAVTWSCSDPLAISCKNGNVECLMTKEGTFTVTATTADGQNATCTVNVTRTGTVVESVYPTVIPAKSYDADSYKIQITTKDYGGYNSGYTVFCNTAAIEVTDKTSSGFTLKVPKNTGSARTLEIYVHGNFSGWDVNDPNTYHTIKVTQPYYPYASGFGPHSEYQVVKDGTIVDYKPVETYFLAEGGTSYRHVQDPVTGKVISGGADIEIRCAREAIESIYNQTTTSASWVKKRNYFLFSYWNIGIEAEPNTTGKSRDAEVYIPGGLTYKVHQDA